jgi:acyl dehydratase
VKFRGWSEDEFLAGQKTMQDNGIEIDRLFEQLADGGRASEADGDNITKNDADWKVLVAMDAIHIHFDRMLSEANDAGFESSLIDDLRTSSVASAEFRSGQTPAG